MLTGVLLSNIGYGLVPPIERDQLPDALPDDAGRPHRSERVEVYLAQRTSRRASPCTRWATTRPRRSSTSSVVAIAMDNPFGHEQIGGFQRVFEDAGGRVVQKIWVPLNALDFAPYLTQVGKDADAVCAVLRGGPGRALRQAVRRVRAEGRACRSSAAAS